MDVDPTSSGAYRRPNTDWLAQCRFGLGVTWTAQTTPRHGVPMLSQKAVEASDLQGFADTVSHTGAVYVMFTITHALQMLP